MLAHRSRSFGSAGVRQVAWATKRQPAAASSASIACFSSRVQPAPYVQETVIPTYHFQKSLMRLPIPKLEDTLARYLAAVEPVVNPAQLQDTKDAVHQFSQREGPKLHEALVRWDKANLHTSYINQWWREMYLQDRQPIAINYNPQIKLKEDPVAAKNTCSQRAASLIASSVRMYATLRDGKLQPDIFHTKPKYSKTSAFEFFCKFLPERVAFYGAAAFGAYPLDMSQYKHLFRSTRIPKQQEDVLKIAKEKESRHVVIQRGSKMYRVDVLNEFGEPLNDEIILDHIEAILAQPLETGSIDKPGVGIFTTMSRDKWAETRDYLIKLDEVNKKSLETIDTALFMVSLDHEKPDTSVETSKQFLVGNGFNHWFDKSFQLIVAANGKASVNFEHAWGDGVAVLRYVNELVQDSIKHPVLTPSTTTAPVNELKWNLDGHTKGVMQQAAKEFTAWTGRLLMGSADTPITRGQIAQYSIGTDGVMQMAIQLAHFKLHQRFVATYESASTAAFKHGRTETVRSCTIEATEFVKTMMDKSASDSERHETLRKAVKKHGELTKNGVMGQGFDRHLFALKKMAAIEGMELPHLFQLPSHEIMSKIILSTSTLSSPNLEGGSFGPVNEDCYGIGYGIEQEGSKFQLSSYRDDLPQLQDLLVESLTEIEQLLARTSSTN